MKESNFAKKENNQYIELKYNESPKALIEEEKLDNNIIPCTKKKKKKKVKKREILPSIKNERNKKSLKDVKKNKSIEPEKIDKKSSKLKLDLDNIPKNKNELKLNTDRILRLDNINDSSSSSENIQNKNSEIDKYKTINTEEIFPYAIKSMYLCKNKKRIKNDSESLNDVFKELMDIKHKIKNIKTIKKNKIYQFNSNLSNIYKSNINNNYNPNDFHYFRNSNKTYYNSQFHTFNLKLKNPKKRNERNIKINLKTNINLVKFKKSENLFKRFNEHINYILHIRESEMNALFNQYQRALEENEKEKDLHFKNRIFPLEMIRKLIKIKDDLTINKYRNEYFKRIDRYDIHHLKIFLDNEKKNVNSNKAKILKV